MTNLHYKIIEVWPDDHLIVARYWTDVLSEETLASDANRNPDGTPVRCRTDVAINLSVPPEKGDDLDKLLVSHAPYEWLKKIEAVRDPNTDTNMDHVKALVGQTSHKTGDEVSKIVNPITPDAIAETDIEALLKQLKN